ncbi:Protein kinase [Orobanche gracilis]
MNLLSCKEEGVKIPKWVPTIDWEDYRCLEDLGRTGVGCVYKVQKVSTGEFFAIKKIYVLSDEVGDQAHLDRIMHDMSLATSLDHPNVMKCLGVCNNDYGIHFLYNWMPYNLCNHKIRDERDLAQIAYQVLKGLNYLINEKRFVFKHLSPGNLLLDPSCGLVKIADVGTVKDKYITLLSVPISPWYMKYIAPENFHMGNDEEFVLHSDRYSKSDAWSLGLCLLEFYNGTFPFDGDDRELQKFLLAGLDLEYGQSGACDCDLWPPRPPTCAPALFCDFISSCLKLDVSERFGINELLKHDFITTHCAVVSEEGDSSHDTQILDYRIYEYDHLELPPSSENDGNIRRQKKKMRLRDGRQ